MGEKREREISRKLTVTFFPSEMGGGNAALLSLILLTLSSAFEWPGGGIRRTYDPQRARNQRKLSRLAWQMALRDLVSLTPPRVGSLAERIVKTLAETSNSRVRYLARRTLGEKEEDLAEELSLAQTLGDLCRDCHGPHCSFCMYDRQLEARPNWMRQTPHQRRSTVEQQMLSLRLGQAGLTALQNDPQREEGRKLLGGIYSHTTHVMPEEESDSPQVVNITGTPGGFIAPREEERKTPFADSLVGKPLGGEETREKGGDDRAFVAYDCSAPTHLHVIHTKGPGRCHFHRPIVRTRRKVAYHLVQEVMYRRVHAKHCQITRSSLPVFCGNYDHQTIVAPDISINQPMAIPGEDCLDLHGRREYQVNTYPEDDETRVLEFKLKMNTTNIATYEAYGKTYYGESEIECTGAKWKSPTKGTTVSNMIEWRSDRIELREEEELLIDDEGKITVAVTTRRLPPTCSVDKESCVTTTGTWVWEALQGEDNCKLYTTRQVQGDELTLTEGEEVKTIFIDNDRLIRLEVREQITKCGETVYTTNYPRFFLIPVGQPSRIRDRKVRGEDVDLTAHFGQRDDWLEEWMTRSLEEFAQRTAEDFCESQARLNANKYATLAAAQNAVIDGGTIALKDGYFATAGGEAWHIYHCREIRVMALDSDYCYDSLPVKLRPKDEEKLIQFERQRQQEEAAVLGLKEEEFNQTTIQFFIEPYSHLLTTASAQVPCVAQLSAHYQNELGRWVAVSPALRVVPAPPRLSNQPLPTPTTRRTRPDFTQGGIYSEATLRLMARHRMLPRVRDLAVISLAGSLPTTPNADPLRSSSFARRLGVPTPRIMGWLNTTYDIIHTYGYVMAFYLGTVHIVMGLWWLFGVCRRCAFPDHAAARRGMRLLHALWPSLTYFIVGTFTRVRGFDDHGPPGVNRRRARHQAKRRAQEGTSPLLGEERSKRANAPIYEPDPTSTLGMMKRLQDQVKLLEGKLAQIEEKKNDEPAYLMLEPRIPVATKNPQKALPTVAEVPKPEGKKEESEIETKVAATSPTGIKVSPPIAPRPLYPTVPAGILATPKAAIPAAETGTIQKTKKKKSGPPPPARGDVAATQARELPTLPVTVTVVGPLANPAAPGASPLLLPAPSTFQDTSL